MEKRTTVNWLDVARAWREFEGGRRPTHGRVGSGLRAFASDRPPVVPAQVGISASTVRRSASALALAERLAEASHLVGAPEDLAHVGLAAMAALSRIEQYGIAQVLQLLPKVIAGTLKGEELLEKEREIRMKFGAPILAKLAGPPADAHLQRLSARSFRQAAIKAYIDGITGVGGRAVALSGKGIFLEAAHAAARSEADGAFHAARVVPAVASPHDRGRVSTSVQLAVALARVVQTFTLIVQDAAEADRLAKQVAQAGPCGVAVLFHPGAGAPQVVHDAVRTVAPDLAGTHHDELERLLSGKGTRRRS